MRPSRTRRRIARALNVLIISGLALAFAPPPAALQAAPSVTFFNDALGDQSNWYWTDQKEVTTTPPVCPPELPGGPPCLSLPGRIPNPDGADTLPVAASNGSEQKVSAIYFDLTNRGVQDGSTIDKLVIELLEEGGRNSSGKSIQACLITDLWQPGEAELWENRPPTGACIEGVSVQIGTPGAPYWRFVLTNLAKDWGTDSSTNNGVMLKPVIPTSGTAVDKTFQINLKIPQRDNAITEDSNEYETTKTRSRLTVDATPPPPEPPIEDGGGDTGGSTGGGVGTGGDIDGGQEVPTTEPSPEPTTEPQTEPVAETLPEPKTPGQVWALLPLGLIALAMTRSAVMEPVAGAADAGVITAIRRRNAERRGESETREAGDERAGLLKKLFGRFAK